MATCTSTWVVCTYASCFSFPLFPSLRLIAGRQKRKVVLKETLFHKILSMSGRLPGKVCLANIGSLQSREHRGTNRGGKLPGQKETHVHQASGRRTGRRAPNSWSVQLALQRLTLLNDIRSSPCHGAARRRTPVLAQSLRSSPLVMLVNLTVNCMKEKATAQGFAIVQLASPPYR